MFNFTEIARRSNEAHHFSPAPSLPKEVPALMPKGLDPLFTPPIAFSRSDESKYGDPEVLSSLYENLVIVYRCVNIRATNIATLPYKIVVKDRKGNEVDVSDLDEFLIFRQPNRFQTRYDFFVESILRLDLQGELFWQLDRAGKGRIAAIYADWRSEEVKVEGDPETLYRSFIRTVNGHSVTYAPEDVFFLKYVNPFNVLRGLSPLRAARSNLILQLHTFTFLKAFFKQGMSLGGVLSTDQGLDPANLERLKNQVQQQYGGVENMHKFLITWAGLKYQPLEKMSLTDADTLNLLGMTGDQIALIYGIPVEIIGTGRNTYENVRQATRNMWEQTLKPLAEKIAQQINLELIPELSKRDVVFKFDFSGIESLQQDKEAVSRVYRTGWDLNAITPNEYRINVLQLDPLDFPEMDMPRFAIENARLQLIQRQGQEQGQRQGQGQQKVFKPELDGIWFKRMAEIDRHETTLRTKLQEFFIRQEQEVLKRVEELFGDQESREGAAFERKIEGVFNVDLWAAELRELGDPVITEIVTIAAQEWLESGEVIDLTHPSVRYALGERVRLFSILPNETTGRKIQQALREGFAAGDSIAGLKERIQQVFAEATDYRANLIARTEAVGASNFGTQAGLRQGKWQFKMWITSRDALVRDNHLIDGQIVPVDGVFTLVNGETRVFPNDFNERCIIIGAQTPNG